MLLSPPERPPSDYSKNPEARRAFLVSVSRLLWMLMGYIIHLSVRLAPALLQLVGLQRLELKLLYLHFGWSAIGVLIEFLEQSRNGTSPFPV